jgi:hypothetical protein
VSDEPARERLAALLGRHYAEERFDDAELDRRLDIVLAGDDPHAALADLPPLADPGPQKRRWSRRHGEADRAQPGWVPTRERFVDPTTQRVMRVWIDPGDHSRRYVPEPR